MKHCGYVFMATKFSGIRRSLRQDLRLGFSSSCPSSCLPMIAVAVFAAQLAIAAGIIEPGPMMPVVGILAVTPLLGLYLYLGLRKVRRYAVGLTEGRLILADVTQAQPSSSQDYPLGECSRFSGSSGLVPKLTIRGAQGVLKLQFPL